MEERGKRRSFTEDSVVVVLMNLSLSGREGVNARQPASQPCNQPCSQPGEGGREEWMSAHHSDGLTRQVGTHRMLIHVDR